MLAACGVTSEWKSMMYVVSGYASLVRNSARACCSVSLSVNELEALKWCKVQLSGGNLDHVILSSA